MKGARRRRIVLYYPQQQRPGGGGPPYCRYTQELPLALLAIAGWPLRDGYEVVIVDGSRHEPDEAHRRVLEACEGALLYATTGILGYQVTDGLHCTRKVKARHPRLPAVIGGWFASVVPELQLRTGLYEAVALGQGELTFRELVAAVDAGEPLDGVAGLALLRDGQLVHTAPREVSGWERLPDPPWQLLDPEDYRGPQRRERDRGSLGGSIWPGRPRFEISYNASFGCPHRCTFCCSPQVAGVGWHALPVDRMLDDLQALQERWGFDGVYFTDANWGVSEARARAVAEGLLARGMRLPHFVFVQAASVLQFKPSTLDLMAESGFYTSVVGAEAGTPETLVHLRKPTRVGQNLQAAIELDRRGTWSLMTYIIGFPGESTESMRATLEEARQVGLRCPRARPEVWPFRPIPGSEEWGRALEAGFQPPKTLEEWGQAGDYWNDIAWPGRIPDAVLRERHQFMFWSSLSQGRPRNRRGRWERRARRRLERADWRLGGLEAGVFHWYDRLAKVVSRGARSAS